MRGEQFYYREPTFLIVNAATFIWPQELRVVATRTHFLTIAEACVVAPWKGDDELSSVLLCPEDRHSLLHDHFRWEHDCFLDEQLERRVSSLSVQLKVEHVLGDSTFKSDRMSAGDTVPRLGGSEVVIVDAATVMRV